MLNQTRRFEDEASFRQAVEKESRASLIGAEWSNLTEDFHPPYDDVDFAEMVNAARASLKQSANVSPDSNARQHRRAHVERAASEASELVESFRLELFGHTNPPFPNQGREAAEWIESQVQEPQTKRLAIEATIPASLKPVESLIWLKDFLVRNLENPLSQGEDDDVIALSRLLKQFGEVRSIDWGMPILEYLSLNSEGELVVMRVQAPDGTVLGRMESISKQLVTALGWKPYAAVHHLLTGGVISPSGVQASTRYRAGRKSFGDSFPMTLVVSDPGSLTERELVAAFRKERFEASPSAGNNRRQRSRIAARSEKVAAFVEETQDMSWRGRFDEWNLRNPEDRFRTIPAIKQAYSRARSL